MATHTTQEVVDMASEYHVIINKKEAIINELLEALKTLVDRIDMCRVTARPINPSPEVISLADARQAISNATTNTKEREL